MYRLLIALLFCLPVRAEDSLTTGIDPSLRGIAAPRTLTVLRTTDTTSSGLAETLQFAVARWFQNSSTFRTSVSPESLPGFDYDSLYKFYKGLDSELLAFVYVENQRITLFLFDSRRPGLFLSASQPLFFGDAQRPSNTYLNGRAHAIWREISAKYETGTFQPIPNQKPAEETPTESPELAYELSIRKYRDSKRLFGELSREKDYSPLYLGASIGMVRFGSNDTAGFNQTSSTVNVGAFIGTSLWRRLSAEAGINLFTYALARADLTYRFPLVDRFLTLGFSAGGGKLLGLVAETDGFDNMAFLRGGALFGPGVCFDIPLLGAVIRGDLKWYFASGKSILLASYGVSYSL